MSFAERVVVWNRWYDNSPEDWRFQFVVWSLLFVGAINMLLTVVTGFPFALLVVLAILAITAVRLPYVLGWVRHGDEQASDAHFHIKSAGWLTDLNRRYEAMPESRRFWVFPAILLVGGAINMMLTIGHGFPFGLLFLLTLLALVLFRAPYAAGWLQGGEASLASAPFNPALEHTASPASVEHETSPLMEHEASPVMQDRQASVEPLSEPGVSDPDHRPS